MNGTGIKGGAFGFRISSINKVRFDARLSPVTDVLAVSSSSTQNLSIIRLSYIS